MVAYGLSMVLVLAAVFLGMFVLRNSHTARNERQQKREQAQREARILDE